ncbi:MAG: BrnT family toxin [Selenomonadaceae bacterium]|nr:BrnT family toxin [Selenomonadaceae bacterium]
MEIEIEDRLFEWDDEKNEINIRKHGINFIDAIEVFFDEFRIERYDKYHSDEEDRWKVIGMVDGVLVVIYTERDDATRIISARPADKSERREYYGDR